LKLKYILVIFIILTLSACGGAAAPAEAPEAAVEEAQPAAETAVEQDETAAEEVVEQPAEEAEAEAQPQAEETEAEAQVASEGEDTTPKVDPLADINPEDLITTDSGLQYVLIEEGTGETPQAGDLVEVHYTGMLEDGTKFDSSYDRGQPIIFPLGTGRVIPGWDEGIALLKVGSKAKLVIPSELAYGETGAGGVIPPDATLIFDVELISTRSGQPTEVDAADFTTTDSGLKYYDLVEGDGAAPEEGQTAVVHYIGWLEDGTMFDTSLLRGQPFSFPVGTGQVIPGWDEGVASMKVGGKRQLIIPAELAYGEKGAGGVIPPNATLVFEVNLLDIQ
jgi:peptidylprolyl isomerase